MSAFLQTARRFPDFRHAHSIEAVVSPGELLYVPPYTFHEVYTLDPSSDATLLIDTLAAQTRARLPGQRGGSAAGEGQKSASTPTTSADDGGGGGHGDGDSDSDGGGDVDGDSNGDGDGDVDGDSDGDGDVDGDGVSISLTTWSHNVTLYGFLGELYGMPLVTDKVGVRCMLVYCFLLCYCCYCCR